MESQSRRYNQYQSSDDPVPRAQSPFESMLGLVHEREEELEGVAVFFNHAGKETHG